MKRTIINIFVLLIVSTVATAQVPQPVEAQNEAILLKGGIAHLGNGIVIQNAAIGFDKGKLTIVADANSAGDIAGYKVIDISGQHVYPGFILPNTQVGITEVSAIRAMNDTDEVGDFAPNVRSLVAYNTDSKIIPTLRFNGVLIAETTPLGGRVSGTSSVMSMEGWNWEDAVLKADMAVHMNWPRRISGRFDFSTFSFIREPNKDYEKQVQEVKNFFAEAVSYGKLSKKERNLKLEGMQGVFSGEQILVIHASGAKDIVESVRFAKENGVKKITLVAGIETLDVTDFLVEHSIPVILPTIHRLPSNDDMDVYLPHKLPALLTKAGVTVALSHQGMLARARNLPFYVGSAIAFGHDRENAIKLVTLNSAKALGIDNEVGSLEKGKRATLFVSKGDAFDMVSNDLSHAFIDGKEIILDHEQQMLFKRYSDKYSNK